MTIRWTEECLQDAEEIIEYIETNWSKSVANRFRIKLTRKVQLLALNPFLGKSSMKQKEIRKLVISKQTSLYYRVVDDVVELLSLFANRRDNHPY